jgi:PhzF family phenazine biosynthesis protein
MRLSMYQVDAFTDRLFGGNPAAVVPLKEWLPDATMQAIAAENNLAETAFFVPDSESQGDGYGLRWFTPEIEVDLCGHATLGTAYVIARFIAPQKQTLSFRTVKAGTLVVTRQGEELAMDFPAWPSKPAEAPTGLAEALGGAPERYLQGKRDGIAVFRSEAEVAALQPDFAALKRLFPFAVMATAPGDGGTDFVSRFFAPGAGIDEDPVTGSAHCALIPYWAERLGKTRLKARQISKRVGHISGEMRGDRVTIGGRVVLYLEGTIEV